MNSDTNQLQNNVRQPSKKRVNWRLLFLIILLFALFMYYHLRQTDSTSHSQWLNKPAPELTVEDINGNTISLSQLKGKRVILDFWATWCPPCRMEIPHFIKLADKYGSDDLVIIGISHEDKETISNFASKNGINYTLAVGDYNMAPPYSEITAIPTTFFIDREGIIRYILEGYHSFKKLESRTKAINTPIDPNTNIESVP